MTCNEKYYKENNDIKVKDSYNLNNNYNDNIPMSGEVGTLQHNIVYIIITITF